MKILLASSEVVPFSKTGGLADVCGALPVALAGAGQQVAVITPAYRSALASGQPITATGVELEIPLGSRVVRGQILESRLPGSSVPVYLVYQPDYFDRPALYGEKGQDFRDNSERFIFFSRAVLEAIRLLELDIDVLHANDWQTGLVPAYLDVEYRAAPRFENIASVFTIHNLAYQGSFWHWDMLLTGLDWKYFNWHQMECFGQVNLMKTGIVFADQITTVSPTYAQEIQSAPLGCGLEGALSTRRDVLAGVINGVDYREWDPQTDLHLPRNYGQNDWSAGKSLCKAALQQELGLPVRDNVPLVGFIGRLVSQKGLDLIEPVLAQRLERDDTQWAFLGSGSPEYEQSLRQFAARFPEKFAVKLEFSNPLAHRIEAASDIFLMPSLYEPCGLNQMYRLKYGAVPLVRATGGLADTITDTRDDSLVAGTANGFSFDNYTPPALDETLTRAVSAWRQKDIWSRIVETAMAQDWSWNASASRYVELYRQTLARRREAIGV